MSFAWVAALLLVSVYHSFLLLALRLQTCNRKPDFLYLWARQKGEVVIYLFLARGQCKRKHTPSWMFVFWQGQSTNLLLLKKLRQTSDFIFIFFRFLKCNMTLSTCLFFFLKKGTMGDETQTAGLNLLLLHKSNYGSYLWTISRFLLFVFMDRPSLFTYWITNLI